MSDLTKQSKNRGKRQNWKIVFAKSAEKSKKENVETMKEITDLEFRMLRIMQVLNIKN